MLLRSGKLLHTYLLQPRLAGLGLAEPRMSVFDAACNDGK